MAGDGGKTQPVDIIEKLLIRQGQGDADILRCSAPVYGRPCRKELWLEPGDGLAFYHGKKARLEIHDPSRRVDPYQITLIAKLEKVQQSADGLQFIEFSTPRKLFWQFFESPLLKSSPLVEDILASTGLGGGAVGALFPIDAVAWQRLIDLL